MNSLADKLARRIEPVIRRGLLVGGADLVRLYSVDGGTEAELWSSELTRESDATNLAAEAAGIAEEEYTHAETARFRVRCYREGEPCGEVIVRAGAKRPDPANPDVVGEALLPKGEPAERSLTRQSMRQAENAYRLLHAVVEKQAALLLPTIEALTKANTDLTVRYLESVAKNAEAVRAEQAHEIELLRTSAEIDAIKEGVGLLKDVGPKIADHFSGASVLHPLLGIVAKLQPEQVDMMVAAGQLTEAEGGALKKAAETARAKVAKGGKALPANATKGNGRVH